MPFSAALTTCDDEDLEESGVGHFHNTATVTPNGDLHVTNHANLAGAGITASGAFYLLNQSDHLSVSIRSVPFVLTEVEHLRLIGQGGVKNLRADALTHITVNAQGELAVSIDRFRILCQV